LGHLCGLQKLPKVNNCPIGEKWPNLITLKMLDNRLEQVFFVVEMVATPILRQNLMHHRIEKTTSRISTFRIARFLLIQTYQKGKIISNGHTLYKITMPSNIPNGHKIYQHFTFQGPPKYIQVWIFC
jgi:hypothetical protein